MIVFGWYSWLISSYTAQELNFPEGDWDNVRFEVRQKCFHLFYIPFFSIGKMYVMRKEGKLYELTNEFELYMRAAKPHKTPWFAFLGPILIPIIFLVYWGNETYENYRGNELSKEWRKENIAKKLDLIENPEVHDFLELSSNRYERFFMRVEQFTKDSIQIGMPWILDGDNRSFRGTDYYNKYYDQLGSQLKTVWIAKNDLKKAIDTDENSVDDFEGRAFPELLTTDTLYLHITEIYRSTDMSSK